MYVIHLYLEKNVQIFLHKNLEKKTLLNRLHFTLKFWAFDEPRSLLVVNSQQPSHANTSLLEGLALSRTLVPRT